MSTSGRRGRATDPPDKGWAADVRHYSEDGSDADGC